MNYTKHYRNCPKEKGSSVAYQVLQIRTKNNLHFCNTSLFKVLFLNNYDDNMRTFPLLFLMYITVCSHLKMIIPYKICASPIMLSFSPNIYGELPQNHSTLFLYSVVEWNFVLFSMFIFGLENKLSFVNKLKHKNFVFSLRYESKRVRLKFCM